MSVLVVGISHKSAPVALLERVALDADGVAKLVAGRRRPASTSPRPRSSPPATGSRSTPTSTASTAASRSSRGCWSSAPARPPRRCCRTSTSTTTTVRSRTCSRSPPASTRWPSARARSSARPATRSRLGQDHGTVGPALNALFQQALRVGKRARAETEIDRPRPRWSGPRSTGPPAGGDVAGRRVVVVGAGAMAGAGHRDRPRRGAAEVAVVNRTAERAERLAARVRRPRGRRSAELPAELAEADVRHRLHRRRPASWSPRAWSRRPAPTAARSSFVDLALPHDVDPDVADCPASRWSTWPTWPTSCATRRRPRGRRGPPDRRPRRSPRSSPPAGRPASRRPWSRCARWRPRWSTPRWRGSTAGCPSSTTRARAEVLHTVRRVADKLLHQPTVRVKELANEPGAVSYAAALAELFALDPEAVDAVTRPRGGCAMTRTDPRSAPAPPCSPPPSRAGRRPAPRPARPRGRAGRDHHRRRPHGAGTPLAAARRHRRLRQRAARRAARRRGRRRRPLAQGPARPPPPTASRSPPYPPARTRATSSSPATG